MSAIKKANFKISGVGSIMFSKPVFEDREDNETHAQLEDRTWKKRLHLSPDGHVFRPSTEIRASLVWSARWLSLKLTGHKTYTKRFQSGMITAEPRFFVTRNGAFLGESDAKEQPLFVPSDGKSGGSKRVWKKFPTIEPPWEIEGSFIITDEAITPEIFIRHLKTSGMHDGLGAMRIGTSGQNGMYTVDSVDFEEYEL